MKTLEGEWAEEGLVIEANEMAEVEDEVDSKQEEAPEEVQEEE